MTSITASKQRVSYFYQPDVGHFYYGPSHPMKPHRIKMAHHLILSYGLYRKMECYRSHPASPNEMSAFHSEDYINFLAKATGDNLRVYGNQMQKFNVGEYTDCPVFDGLYEFTQLYTGASLDGAVKLNRGDCDVAINWSGGLHHAKKSEASGFCYINDIVLAILELLKVHARVLYIDIEGTGFSVNAPLTSGMTDDAYEERIFKPVMDKIMEVFRPGAIVLQCGADSLTGNDRLGCFNLTLKGHAECVRYTKSFNVPTLVCSTMLGVRDFGAASTPNCPTDFELIKENANAEKERRSIRKWNFVHVNLGRGDGFFIFYIEMQFSDMGRSDRTDHVNAPLTSGMTDDAYEERIFKPVMDKIMEVFRPGAIVLQCGADSLTGDRLGCFNLTLKGHAECVRYTKSFNVPTLVLGGGGYTIRNVARCWAYETSVLLDTELPDEIPYNDYFEYYAPDYKLHLTPEQRENMNTEASLESVRVDLLTQLMSLKGAPSVQMSEVPPDFELIKEDANAEKERRSTRENREGDGMNDGGAGDD
eukprot:CAMPEP_0201988664 /NCGR_PEP_ID=MMETSP0904-20121228/92445_1 /ASSEMBLY_ACC=CAM_ASM_000553 /TAXON_ID=420261 /ORGANISM="Thalassiosira antarctica, Strain CCMP982" /LENGTH=532 /DNA_ID=CAMNT_0048542845 /DNA_START=59 /DNA_END=1656 /DNA_ORIENTATION=+